MAGASAGRLSRVSLASFLALSLAPGALRAELSVWASSGGAAPVKNVAVALSTSAPPHVDERDTFMVEVAGPAEELPSTLDVESRDTNGRALGRVTVPLVSAACDSGAPEGASCAHSSPLLVIASGADVLHPSVRGRALVGRVGGQLLVSETEAQTELATIRVVGGLGDGPLRARLRVLSLAEPRERAKGGPLPALGSSAEEALELARAEVERASSVLGACGIELAVEQLAVVNLPAPRYLMVGCRGAALASGGEIVVSSTRRGSLRFRTRAGQTPREVGLGLAELLRSRGGAPVVLDNPLVSADAHPTVDLDLGAEVLGVRSNDPTLGVCPLVLDTGDGIDHFKDGDSSSGTTEERALLRALGDDDRTTIEVIVVAHFAGRGRIGESFIHTPGGAMENAVILDRSGVYAGPHSATLAHELGHVLLQLPGHTDDFGVDTPRALMDSDASDPTSAGPRRLEPEDCLRALRETGPGTYESLLAPVAPSTAK